MVSHRSVLGALRLGPPTIWPLSGFSSVEHDVVLILLGQKPTASPSGQIQGRLFESSYLRTPRSLHIIPYGVATVVRYPGASPSVEIRGDLLVRRRALGHGSIRAPCSGRGRVSCFVPAIGLFPAPCLAVGPVRSFDRGTSIWKLDTIGIDGSKTVLARNDPLRS